MTKNDKKSVTTEDESNQSISNYQEDAQIRSGLYGVFNTNIYG